MVSVVSGGARRYSNRAFGFTGICFGHQIVARALGGECVPNGGNWEVGLTKIDLTETGKKLFGVSELVGTTLKL